MLFVNYSEISCTSYSIIIIYDEAFLYFFPNQFFQHIAFFCILGEENQEAFSEKCYLMSGALQGLVKICKKYMEVNLFLLLSCTTLKLKYS